MSHNEINLKKKGDLIKYVNIPFPPKENCSEKIISYPFFKDKFPFLSKDIVKMNDRIHSIKEDNHKLKSHRLNNVRLALVPSKKVITKSESNLDCLNNQTKRKNESKSQNKTLYKSNSNKEFFPIFSSYTLLSTKNKVDKIFSPKPSLFTIKSEKINNKRTIYSSSQTNKNRNKIHELSLNKQNSISKILLKSEYLHLKGKR